MNETTIEVRKWAVQLILNHMEVTLGVGAATEDVSGEEIIAEAKKLEAYVLGDEPMLKYNITNFQVS